MFDLYIISIIDISHEIYLRDSLKTGAVANSLKSVMFSYKENLYKNLHIYGEIV